MSADSRPLEDRDWIAIAAHRLAHRWPHVAPLQLDEVAAELARDAALRGLAPADAVTLWLQPLEAGPGVRETYADRLVA